MSVREIVTVGHPVLRERAREVDARGARSAEVQQLIDDLIETKRAANGAGLAANQVGEPLRIAVAEVEGTNPRYPYKPPIPLTVIVNPVIEPLGRRDGRDQRGLPLGARPARRGSTRHVNVRVRYLDREGAEHERGRARAHRRDLPARGRPPRRHPVPRPRRPADAHDLGAVRAPPARGVRRPRVSRVRGAGRLVSAYWCELAWLGGERAEPGVAGRGRGRADRGGRAPACPTRRADAERLAGLTLPGFANAHSHAFHRALRGRTQAGRGLVLDLARADVRARRRARPRRLPRARPGDVRRDGARRDHRRRRVPLPPPRAGRRALRGPERDGQRADRRRGARPGSGSRCSTPATCTAASASRSTGPQRRFADGDADAWAERVEALGERAERAHRAPRSTASARSTPTRRATVAAWAASRERPLHAHVSEQPAENEACRAAHGATPTGVLDARGALVRALHRGPRDPPDRRRHRGCSGAPAATCCLCPTTERDLADGIGPRGALADAGAALALGIRLARGDRPVRGGARGGARRAPRDRRARPPRRGRAAARGDGRRPRARSAGPRPAGSSRARSPTWSRSASTASRLAGTPSAETARGRSSSPPRPPTSRRDLRRAAGRPRRPPRRARRRGRASRARSERSRVTALVDRQHRPAGHQRPRARRGPARARPRRGAGDRGRPRRGDRAGRRRRRRAHRRRRALRDPRLRRQPHPPGVRRRPRRGVRRPDGRARRTRRAGSG